MRIILSMTITVCLFVSNVAASCEGSLQQSHSLDGYEFDTTSRLFEQDNQLVYQTCVENRGSRALQINWYIPNFHSWIPAGESVSSNRYSTRPRPNPVPVKFGCLGYGNLEEPHRAQLHLDDVGLDRLTCEARTINIEERVIKQSEGLIALERKTIGR